MVAGHVNDAGAAAHLAQHFLHDVVVALRPIPRAAQPPAIDNVADQIDRAGIVEAEKIKQQLCFAAAGAEVHVGYPDRAVLVGMVRHSLSHTVASTHKLKRPDAEAMASFSGIIRRL
jgi:hypothetical protein